MPPVDAVDIHAHFYPQRFLDLVAEAGGGLGARVSRADPAGPIVEVGSLRVGPLRAAFTDLRLRLREMDRQGVGVQALSLTLPMVYWAGEDLGVRLARAVNDALAEAHAAFPARFVGLATLPMHVPRRAVDEVDRAARLPGIRGLYLGTNIAGRELSDPDFFPVYARAEALGLPLFLHPIDVIGGGRLAPHHLHNLLGNPFDTAVAAAQLVFGGVLDRFRRLRVCLPHAGGALPFLVGRLDRGWRVRPECRHLRRPPSAYLRRFLYDTVSHSAQALRYLIDLVGAERVMLGSDYCFDMGTERPRQQIEGLPGLARAARARILGGNARRLLRLA